VPILFLCLVPFLYLNCFPFSFHLFPIVEVLVFLLFAVFFDLFLFAFYVALNGACNLILGRRSHLNIKFLVEVLREPISFSVGIIFYLREVICVRLFRFSVR
jgi:hypothetical protein